MIFKYMDADHPMNRISTLIASIKRAFSWKTSDTQSQPKLTHLDMIHNRTLTQPCTASFEERQWKNRDKEQVRTAEPVCK